MAPKYFGYLKNQGIKKETVKNVKIKYHANRAGFI